ncbi:MAG: DUF2318 domain-containing protein [Actinobacteria bacterium]|nr:DUF2318 domain-containing protein [Actinomycetota bacterium]
MIAAMVIMLREGVEAALVVGIVLTYLAKVGRKDLDRKVYWALGVAVGASLALAVVFERMGIDPENEYLEGILLGVAGLFVVTMVAWMWRTGRSLKAQVEARLEVITTPGERKAAGAGLFGFTFLMVLREGIEATLFLKAAALGDTSSAGTFIGGLLGLGVAVLFAVLFIRGSLRINLSRFFRITALALLVLAVKLLAGSVHEFAERGIVPLTETAMMLIGYFVRGRSGSLITTALIAVPIVLLLWESWSGSRLVARSGEGAEDLGGPVAKSGAAERRKRQAARRLERLWQVGLAGITGVVVLTMTSTALAGDSLIDPAPQPVTATAGTVSVAASQLPQGEVQKFVYSSADGSQVRFIVARLADGSTVGALDACEICGAIGYGQDGPVAVCKNCAAPIALDSFTFGGGCNPRPLAMELTAGGFSIAQTALEAAAPIFR